MAHATPMPGDKAPRLTFDVLDGSPVDLSADHPENFSIVFFYRGVHCPICRKQLEELVARRSDFEAIGAKFHVVSMDSVERAERQKKEWTIEGLPIGYGMSEETAREWGLFISAKEQDAEPDRFSEPGIAVLYPDGRIYALYFQTVPFARPRLDDLLGSLKFVLERDYPIRGKLAA